MSGITYQIGGKYNPKGVNDAKRGLKDLKNSAKGISGSLKGISKVIKTAFVFTAVTKGISAVKSLSSSTVNDFYSQSNALSKLNASLTNNSKLTVQAVKNIKNVADSMPRIFDDDSINNATAYLSTMKLNEEQITSTLKAAMDLSATGVMPLDQAVKSLAQTYNGTSGTIGKILPQVKDLTKEQLENGEAVKLVAKEYEGMSVAMSETFSGRTSQFQNALGNLKASIGGVFASISFDSQGKLMEPLMKVTEWIETNRDKIINFFIHFPEIAKSVFGNILNMLDKTFTSAGLKNLFGMLGTYLFESFKASLLTIFNLFKSIFTTIGLLLNQVLGNPFRVMEDAIAKVGNKLIEVINSVLRKVVQNPLVSWLYEFFTDKSASSFQGISFRFDTTHAQNNVDWDTTLANIKSTWKGFIDDEKKVYSDAVSKVGNQAKDFAKFYEKDGKKLVDDIKVILNKDLPADLRNALSNTVNVINGNTLAIDENTDATEDNTEGKKKNGESSALGGLAQIFSALGDFGAIIQGIMSSNWIGLIIQLVSAVTEELKGICENLNILSNGFSEIAKIAVQFIDVANLNNVLQPFVDGIAQLGKIIGVVLDLVFHLADAVTPLNEFLTEILTVVADLLCELQPLLNLLLSGFRPIFSILTALLRPLLMVLNLVVKVIETIYNFLVTVVVTICNFFSWIWNKIYSVLRAISLPTSISIGWKGISVGWTSLATLIGAHSVGYLDKDDYALGSSDYNSTNSSSSSSSSGGSASYTAAKDTYVNIYFNSSYVNGDAQQIAIMLAQEIKSAERMNLIA